MIEFNFVKTPENNLVERYIHVRDCNRIENSEIKDGDFFIVCQLNIIDTICN